MKSNKFCDPRNLDSCYSRTPAFNSNAHLYIHLFKLKPETFTKPNVVALE